MPITQRENLLFQGQSFHVSLYTHTHTLRVRILYKWDHRTDSCLTPVFSFQQSVKNVYQVIKCPRVMQAGPPPPGNFPDPCQGKGLLCSLKSLVLPCHSTDDTDRKQPVHLPAPCLPTGCWLHEDRGQGSQVSLNTQYQVAAH